MRTTGLFLCFLILAASAAGRTFTVNSAGDAPDGDVGDGIPDTGRPGAYTGLITLRVALQNSQPGDLINFQPQLPTIFVESPLPGVNASIDGGPGMTVINGSQVATEGAVGLRCDGGAAEGVVLSNLVLQQFNGAAIVIAGHPVSRADLVVVADCFIGTDREGTAAPGFGNEDGILVVGVNGTLIVDCLISGNAGYGVQILPNLANGDTSYDNKVAGCIIGLDATGTQALPNLVGISIGELVSSMFPGYNVVGTVIGGYLTGEGNVISGNERDGIQCYGDMFNGPSNRIEGNIIGGCLDGEFVAFGKAIGNGRNGILVSSHDDLQIGGIFPGVENIIVGNGKHGIEILSESSNASDDNFIQGNLIGGMVGVAPNPPLGNSGDGIYIGERALGTQIGASGTDLEELELYANTISFNGGNGVTIVGSASRQHAIRGNIIFENSALGIDLNGDGISHPANNPPGVNANAQQPAPVFKSIVRDGTNTIITASISTNFNPPFTVDVFSNLYGNAEGETLIHSQVIPFAQRSNFVMTIPGTHTALTMTMTDNGGNTSEFSTLEIPFIVNSAGDAPDDNPGDGITSTGAFIPDGRLECTLRAAIMEANVLAGYQTILFDIPGAAPHTIALQSALPPVTQSAGIDATSEPGYSPGNPRIELSGANLGQNPIDGLTLAAGDSSVRGLAIRDFPRNGITVSSVENIIEACTIGFNAAGAAGFGVNGHGIHILNGTSNRIGGSIAAARNVIAGSGTGKANLALEGPGSFFNTIQGNYIGTDKMGNNGQDNPDGIRISGGAALNLIGGAQAAQGNVISSNLNGIHLIGADVSGNDIQGNTIGLNAAGTQFAGNNASGIRIDLASNNRIGAATSAPGVAPGNIIASNLQDGIELLGEKNWVQGNRIGTNSADALNLGNGRDGIRVGEEQNIIGDLARERNIISGNGADGIRLEGFTARTTGIYGNYIGVNAAGTAAIPNLGNGIHAYGAVGATIGSPGERVNVISGNLEAGVRIDGGPDGSAELNWVLCNMIGTTADGTTPLGNTVGIEINNAANNTIGGRTAPPTEGNLISGNQTHGILINGCDPGNAVRGNIIGLNAGGGSPLPNLGHGIAVVNSLGVTIGGFPSMRNLISGNGGLAQGGNGIMIDGAGGTGQNAAGHEVSYNTVGLASGGNPAGNQAHGIRLQDTGGNVIGPENIVQHNALDGIALTRGTAGDGNRITQNSIFDNGGLGIDLGDDGVTPNDANDADNGANRLQNYPESLVAYGASLAAVQVALQSTPDSDFQLEVFSSAVADSSGFGEGEQFETSVVIRTDGGGHYGRAIPLPLGIAVGRHLTITATRLATQDTSEFSAGAVIQNPGGGVDFGDGAHYFPRLAQNGPRHMISGGLQLGSQIDAETDALLDGFADGDDLTGSGDEDGVTFPDPLSVEASPTNVIVTASAAGLLDAWIDFNCDLDFSDAGEQIAAARALNTGDNTLNLTVPDSVVTGLAVARFRFSAEGGLDPTGAAFNGEVEDHAIFIYGRNGVGPDRWSLYE